MNTQVIVPVDFDVGRVDFAKGEGLVPAIVQDEATRQVLMLGYQNAEALDSTLMTGEMWFFSRSRNQLWRKGETSGNTLRVKMLAWDCDQDTLLYQAVPAGPTCHTGAVSCFGAGDFSLQTLESVIQTRAQDPSDKGSYTRKLLDDIPLNLAKITEEASEVVQAIEQKEGKQRLTNEAADVIYHLMVLLVGQGISLSDVERVLADRQGKRREG